MKISRILILLLALAALKLTLLGSMGVEKLTHVAAEVAEVVAPVAGVEVAQAQTAAAQNAQDKAANDQAAQGGQGTGADDMASSMGSRPEGMDESDWKVLKKREEELAAKERSLKELESQLGAQLVEIEQRNEQLRRLLEEVRQVEDERLQKLVKAYANMKAKSAAAVLETMDQDLAVKILSGLGGRQAGEILGFIETRKAALLSEALTDLRVPFEE